MWPVMLAPYSTYLLSSDFVLGAGATALEGALHSRNSQRKRGRDNCAGSCNETGIEGKVHLSSGCLGSTGEEHSPCGPGEDSGKEGSGM